MAKRSQPKYRKWIATYQNPDPTVDFVHYMHTLVPDLKFMVWSYEKGATGNLHNQIYFEVSKQYSAGMMIKALKGMHTEFAYAPRAAENYACKADHTLIDGPWTWTEPGHKRGPGARNDLNDVYEAVVKNGSTYDSLKREGKHLTVLAKHERFVKQLENLADEATEPVSWPKTFHGFDMLKPDPAIKKRHWWIVGPPDAGKSLEMGKLFNNQKAYYIAGDSENRWERYDNEEVIIYDDNNHNFAELSVVSQTINFPMDLPGKIRYVGKTFRRNSCRNIIILSNKTIEESGYSAQHIIAIHHRFIVIDMNIPVLPLVHAGFKRPMTDDERCKQKQCKHVEGECPISINDDF